MVQSLELLNGPELHGMIYSNPLFTSGAGKQDPRRLVDRLYRAALSPAGHDAREECGPRDPASRRVAGRGHAGHAVGAGVQSRVSIHQVEHLWPGTLDRRQFLTQSLSGGGAWCAAGLLPGFATDLRRRPKRLARPSSPAQADSVIFIWLPGGIAQTDTWDPKAAHALRARHEGQRAAGHLPVDSHAASTDCGSARGWRTSPR